jgi:hypothetical protein
MVVRLFSYIVLGEDTLGLEIVTKIFDGSTLGSKKCLIAQYPDGNILSGHDFRRNMETAWDLQGQYATEVLTDEALRIIQEHDKCKPLFLYLGHLAVHAGNAGKLLEAPQEAVNKFRHIKEPNRRTYAGRISAAGQICLCYTVFEFMDTLPTSSTTWT